MYLQQKQITLKSENTLFKSVQIKCDEDAVNTALQFYHDDIQLYESAFIIMLNTQNNSTAYAKISQGGICGTVVDIRIICKYAIDSLASGIIFIHNHPGGSTEPSENDIKITIKLQKALELIDVVLHDSIIITKTSYKSIKFKP